jgi:hypothetical protein
MLFDRATDGERLISGSDAAADGRYRSDQSPLGMRMAIGGMCSNESGIENSRMFIGARPTLVGPPTTLNLGSGRARKHWLGGHRGCAYRGERRNDLLGD